MRLLTEGQILEIRSEMSPVQNHPDGVGVRFMEGGRTLANLTTGQFHSRGVNVLHLTHFWRFSEATARKIADYTGLKAVVSRRNGQTSEYHGKTQA